MFKELGPSELQRREDETRAKLLERTAVLEAVGITLTHDKLYCFYRWQLDELEAAKAVAAA